MGYELRLWPQSSANADLVLMPPGANTFGVHLWNVQTTSDVVLRYEYYIQETVAAAPTPVSGDAALVEENDSFAAIGLQTIIGQAAITEGGDAVAGAGLLSFIGAASCLEDDDAVAAEGSMVVSAGVDAFIVCIRRRHRL